MKTYESIALGIPDILLPHKNIDLSKWAVIACDQYTSEPEYWQKVSDLVGESPSALNLIYPEVYLGENEPEKRIDRIKQHMQRYLDQGIFQETEGLVYVERRTGQHIRKGFLACLDLEQYDFHQGASTLIRATEGTILERIPPRVRIREGAPLEIPHIMVLIDDPDNTVIGPLTKGRKRLTELYDFDLMMDSGHLTGYRVDDSDLEKTVVNSLQSLAEPRSFCTKYDGSPHTPVLLYAMGDGNHSFATAKTLWKKTKDTASDTNAVMTSPLRYGLVEVVNLHDEALVFEPIHRVLFKLTPPLKVVDEMIFFYPQRCCFVDVPSAERMTDEVDSQQGNTHKIGVITNSGFGVIEVSNPDSHLPAGTLQNFLHVFLENERGAEIDYVHGTDTVVQLGGKPGNIGFYLPAMNKHDLFKTVILDGALPRKTFSMGEAWEKRFYLEVRKLF